VQHYEKTVTEESDEKAMSLNTCSGLRVRTW